MLQQFRYFIREEAGASAIEYGLIIGMIAAVLVVVLGLLGVGTSELFGSVCAKLADGSC